MGIFFGEKNYNNSPTINFGKSANTELQDFEIIVLTSLVTSLIFFFVFLAIFFKDIHVKGGESLHEGVGGKDTKYIGKGAFIGTYVSLSILILSYIAFGALLFYYHNRMSTKYECPEGITYFVFAVLLIIMMIVFAFVHTRYIKVKDQKISNNIERKRKIVA